MFYCTLDICQFVLFCCLDKLYYLIYVYVQDRHHMSTQHIVNNQIFTMYYSVLKP